MRWVIGLLAVLAALWTGYWFLTASTLERGIATWFEDRRAEGWTASYSDLGVGGFPLDFVIALSDIDLEDPVNGTAWSAPGFEIRAQSFRPNDITAIWPPTQVIAWPGQQALVASQEMSAGIRFVPGRAMEIDEIRGAAAAVEVTLTAGPAMWGLETGSFAMTRRREAEATYDVALALANLRLDPATLAQVDEEGVLPPEIAEIVVEARVAFDAPWDRFAVERGRPQPTELELAEAAVQWGEVRASATGTLGVDENGQLTGELRLRLENWPRALAAAQATGLLLPDARGRVEGALSGIAEAAGPDAAITVPLRFARGRMFLGPVPIGRSPQIVLP